MRSGARAAWAGGVVWLAALAWRRPHPMALEWAQALLMLAPLVTVPLGLDLARTATAPGPAARLLRLAAVLQPAGALCLLASFALEPGETAGLLALPWLAVTGVIALAGFARLWRRARGLLSLGPLEELCLEAGLLFLAVGGGWTALSRADLRPLDFSVPIVLLTGVHFHYAGFALPLLTSQAGRYLGGGRLARAAALGVIAGVPLVATGITASQLGAPPLLESTAVSITSLAGLLTAALHLRLARAPTAPPAARALWLLTALALVAGMALSGLYGLRAWLPIPGLSLPWMWALHGTANSVGFALAGLTAWELADRSLRGVLAPHVKAQVGDRDWPEIREEAWRAATERFKSAGPPTPPDRTSSGR